MFSKNMHSIDRGARILGGLILISLAFIGPANLWFLLGVIPLLTGIVGFCPVYKLFGVNGYDIEHSQDKSCCQKDTHDPHS